MKNLRYCVTETIVHECFMQIDEHDESLQDQAELEDVLLDNYYNNGSNDILSDDAVVSYIDM